MLHGFAHAALCVPDVDEATRWYSEVLGLQILSPPYRMAGPEIERDLGELVPAPVVVKAAIVGFGPDDHVIELIEYPDAEMPVPPPDPSSIVQPGLTHLGLLCEDIEQTRRKLTERGVRFLVSGVADVVGLRTTWFADPWGNVFILLEKRRSQHPYWAQYRQ